MNRESARTWLRAVCSDFPRKGTEVPFRAGEWAIGTDYKIMVGVREPGILDGEGLAEDGVREKALGYLVDGAAERDDWRDATVNDLREFSGPVTGPCPDCSENGPQDECDTCGGPYCYACGGSGEADPEAKDRVGRIYGRLVNRRLLARLLEHAPDDPVRVSTGEEESSPVYIAGDDWTAIIMPMREPSHESQWHYSLPQPEFDPERAPTP